MEDQMLEESTLTEDYSDESQQTESEETVVEETAESTPQDTTEQSQPGAEKPNYYTDEEYYEFLEKSPLHMDRSRVSPEHLRDFDAVVKRERAVIGDYTRKTQGLAQKQKEFEMQNLTPEERFYREFATNPVNVRKDVHRAIRILEKQKLAAIREADDNKVDEIEANIARIEEALDEAEAKYVSEASFLNSVKDMETSFNAEIVKDFPDYFSGRAESLTKHLVNEGIDNRVIALMAYPPVLDHILKSHGITDIDGVTASKQIIRCVNKAYERANPAKIVEKKEVKKPPHTGASSTDLASEPNLDAVRKKAMKEGDLGSWANYLLEKSKVA